MLPELKHHEKKRSLKIFNFLKIFNGTSSAESLGKDTVRNLIKMAKVVLTRYEKHPVKEMAEMTPIPTSCWMTAKHPKI